MAALASRRTSYPSDTCSYSAVDVIPTAAHKASVGPALAAANTPGASGADAGAGAHARAEAGSWMESEPSDGWQGAEGEGEGEGEGEVGGTTASSATAFGFARSGTAPQSAYGRTTTNAVYGAHAYPAAARARPGSTQGLRFLATSSGRPSVVHAPELDVRPGTAAPVLALRTQASQAAGEAADLTLPASLRMRGRDEGAVPKGYRIIERSGSQTFQDARVGKSGAHLKSLALVRLHVAEAQQRSAAWEARQLARGEAAGSAGQQLAAEAAETVARVVAQREFPRPPPPHPMWRTTYMGYGARAAEQGVTKELHYPRLQGFSNSYHHSGPYKNRGLATGPVRRNDFEADYEA